MRDLSPSLPHYKYIAVIGFQVCFTLGASRFSSQSQSMDATSHATSQHPLDLPTDATHDTFSVKQAFAG